MTDGIGERIAEAIRKSGYSTGMLAIKTGISERTIRWYISGGHQPNAHSLRALCVALRVSADWILGINIEEGKHD